MDGLLVKHKKQIKVVSKRTLWIEFDGEKYKSTDVSIRGLLHKDSLFGKRTPPDCPEAMHIRRPLKLIKSITQAEKIVDPVIRDLVKKQLKKNEIEGRSGVANSLMGENSNGFPRSKINLPNKKGDPYYAVFLYNNS